jgi:hypothetical protein
MELKSFLQKMTNKQTNNNKVRAKVIQTKNVLTKVTMTLHQNRQLTVSVTT